MLQLLLVRYISMYQDVAQRFVASTPISCWTTMSCRRHTPQSLQQQIKAEEYRTRLLTAHQLMLLPAEGKLRCLPCCSLHDAPLQLRITKPGRGRTSTQDLREFDVKDRGLASLPAINASTSEAPSPRFRTGAFFQGNHYSASTPPSWRFIVGWRASCNIHTRLAQLPISSSSI